MVTHRDLGLERVGLYLICAGKTIIGSLRSNEEKKNRSRFLIKIGHDNISSEDVPGDLHGENTARNRPGKTQELRVVRGELFESRENRRTQGNGHMI